MQSKANWKTYFATFILILTTTLTAFEQSLLKSQDINKIMHQILEHHVNKREVTTQIIQSSITNFINQFDPHRIYLLQSEVNPYLKLSDNQLNELVEEYKKNDFSIFNRLNSLFQSSINRSRKIRPNIEEEAKQTLFQVKPTKDVLIQNKEDEERFPIDENELKTKIKKYLEIYIETQRQRYSDAIIAQRKNETIDSFETYLKNLEDQYLYINEKGEPLPAIEKENLFSIHILKALASSLDSHTSFYQTNEAFDMRVLLQKEFQGVGLILKDNPEGPTVTHFLEGGPAAKSGVIKKGDILIEIDGKSVAEHSFDKIMDILHDSNKEETLLMFKHKGVEGGEDRIYTVKLKREMIVLNNDRVDSSYETFGNGIIGKITLHSFYQGDGISSEIDVRNAIFNLKSKGNIKGLILDLRENSGGFLSQAVKVASLFISNGIIVISKYSDGEERVYRDVDGKITYDGPMVVLVSKVTASAAEIVAQALQDYGVAVIVGDEHTYGKGTIQTQTITDNQSASYFKVTVGKYYTVSGKTPQKEGVKADIVVPGHWSKQVIGEEYLVGAVGNDKIPPSYDDDLSDMSPEIKSWYLKYYIPKLQHKVLEWNKMLPVLSKNSEYRIANNKNYQFFLKDGKVIEDDETTEEEEILGSSVKRQKDFGEDDLQVQEAVNIIKDMILLHTTDAVK